jgi:hypothetical protein
VQNYVRHSTLNNKFDGYSIMNASAHNHGLVIHYVTLEKQFEELESAGFSPKPAVYENTAGRRVRPGDDTSSAWWLHYVARKPE